MPGLLLVRVIVELSVLTSTSYYGEV